MSKKPKTKLEKAKERFVDRYRDSICGFGIIWRAQALGPFVRQLNKLIRLAKQEEREGENG